MERRDHDESWKTNRVIFGGGAGAVGMQQWSGGKREQCGSDGSGDEPGGDGAGRGDGCDITAADRLHEVAV